MVQAEVLKRAREYVALENNMYFKNQVTELIAEENLEELNDRFYTDLAFGTGGLRGLIGGGYNRINTFVVQRATQGLANYIKKTVGAAASAVIAFDSRNFSDTFALDIARVMAGNGIKTYLFESLRPTPELSFAVRYLKATCGIVVTASHNPAEYNGYKAYWNDGAQVLPPHDQGIIEEVRVVTTDIRSLPREEAEAAGLLESIGAQVDAAFMQMVKGLSLRPELVKNRGKDLKVVFTPLHGTGALPVSRVLEDMGIEVLLVPEQKDPDGNFPTVKFPNPEEASAMELSLKLARKVGADLVMGTDPDADRLGIAVAVERDFRLVTGNQLGVLLADYIFSTRRELGTLPARPAFVKTIVTTELQRLVAEKYGVACYDTLTGFKYIGEKIREFESMEKGPVYLFGGEESYGYLIGTEVRDKDAVSAATMTAEMALYHLSRGKSLLERLEEIYVEFGYFQEALISKYFKGESGLKIMTGMMSRLRQQPPVMFAGVNMRLVKDFQAGTTLTPATGQSVKNIDLPASNVLQFILEDDTVVSARPSGTEPKIKFYISCCSQPGTPLSGAQKIVEAKIEAIEAELNLLID